ncbi:hypothetical protein [Metallosphaera tengchongensis]|nr:hypothetical protein [Metallosphaera tengchongensis]
MPWKVKCSECNTEYLINVSFDISRQKSLYYFCRTCKKNTFNEILGYME